MTFQKYLISLLVSVAIIALSVPLTHVQGKSANRPAEEVYSGNMIYFDGTFGPLSGLRRGGHAGSGTAFFRLTINSYTPENEITDLLNALQVNGQDGLMKKLGKEKRGTLQIGTNLARDLQAVWVSDTEEGHKITALAERWLGFNELRRGARSADYPLTYVEIYVDETGRASEGSLIPAARVRSKGGNTIEVENFGIYPARLTNIKLETNGRRK